MKEPDRCYNQFTGKAKEARIHMAYRNFEMNLQMNTNLAFPQEGRLSLHWTKFIPVCGQELFCTDISHLHFIEL